MNAKIGNNWHGWARKAFKLLINELFYIFCFWRCVSVAVNKLNAFFSASFNFKLRCYVVRLGLNLGLMHHLYALLLY